MEEDNIKNLMAMVNDFSEHKVDQNCFSWAFKSPLIIEYLNDIYGFQQNQNLSLEDTLKIKQVFQAHFIPFNESFHQASNQCSQGEFVLSLVFFSLMLLSAVACIFLPIIATSLMLIFFSSWVILACLTQIPIYPFEMGDVQRDRKLSILEYHLRELRDLLVDKYKCPIEVINSHFFKIDKASIDQKTLKNSDKKKKRVSFSSPLFEYYVEPTGMQSPINSYASCLRRASAEV